jgi:hypothetical protein
MERFRTLVEAIEKGCNTHPGKTNLIGGEVIDGKLYHLVYLETTGNITLIEQTKEGCAIHSIVTPWVIISKLLEE